MPSVHATEKRLIRKHNNMFEEVAKGIFKIEIPLEGNPLRELNSYFIRGDERDILIDTGFRTESCLKALKGSLEELEFDPKRMDVLLTHFHADHSGLSDVICDPGRHIYMAEKEFEYEMSFSYGSMFDTVANIFRKEGYPEELIIGQKKPEYIRATYDRERFKTVTENDIIQVGAYNLKPVMVPGHTPSNMMLYDEDKKLMFTSDHILFTISPNISMFPGVKDSLGDYLNSLKYADAFDVELALPSHRESGDYHKRIMTIIEHHKRRLDQILEILDAHHDLDAYSVASRMTWKIRCNSWEDFPPTQKWFAMSECIAHLRHLCLEGKVTVYEDSDGVNKYNVV